MTKYFGAYGVRGRVGELPITPDFVMHLGYAAGTTLAAREYKRGSADRKNRPAVLIGKDTRISGYLLESALEAGFSAAGVDVMLAGPIPTPAVAYLTRALRLQAGIVISASHNPYSDNGIKFFSALGTKVNGAFEAEIEARLDESMGCMESAHLGKAYRINDAAGRYIEFCKNSFPADLDLRGLKIVVDCAHGAAYQVGPAVFHELGADVVPIGTAPNGLNINGGLGSTSPEIMCRTVLDAHADMGIALDGDGDRVVMADAAGRIYDGDLLLYVIAQERLATGKPEGVVGTVVTNTGVELALERLGAGFARAGVGDRHVLEMMIERNWFLGGEDTGHIICRDLHTTSDGIVAALQVLSALRRRNTTLEKACADVVLYAQSKFDVALTEGFDWNSDPLIQTAVRNAFGLLGHQGRVLIRASGTEPVLRVLVEGPQKVEVAEWARRIGAAFRGQKNLALREFDDEELVFSRFVAERATRVMGR